MDDGYILIHLGMTGIIKFFKKSFKARIEKHDHYEIKLKDASTLRYNDVRKFGSIHWTKDINTHFLIKNLGVEPLSKNFNISYFKDIIKNRSVSIKNLIMNQNIVVGVGNIYASESLFLAGISPKREAGKTSKRRYNILTNCIKNVLADAINNGGTTLNDFSNVDGNPGYFSQVLNVYGRESMPCMRCHGTIKKIVQNQRSTYYCPSCQH